jgi:hypothetical protein
MTQPPYSLSLEFLQGRDEQLTEGAGTNTDRGADFRQIRGELIDCLQNSFCIGRWGQ